LLKDEGYLMFTLPVPEWKLTASKGIAALCTLLLTTLTWFFAALIFGLINNFDEVLAQLPDMVNQLSLIGSWRLILGTAITVVVILQQLYLVYAAMTVSQIAPRFRRLAGFGVYLAVFTGEAHLTKAVYYLSYPYFLPAILLLETLLAALYLWCTSWLLKHTLNME
jgi:hypothetical protein